MKINNGECMSSALAHLFPLFCFRVTARRFKIIHVVYIAWTWDTIRPFVNIVILISLMNKPTQRLSDLTKDVS